MSSTNKVVQFFSFLCFSIFSFLMLFQVLRDLFFLPGNWFVIALHLHRSWWFSLVCTVLSSPLFFWSPTSGPLDGSPGIPSWPHWVDSADDLRWLSELWRFCSCLRRSWILLAWCGGMDVWSARRDSSAWSGGEWI